MTVTVDLVCGDVNASTNSVSFFIQKSNSPDNISVFSAVPDGELRLNSIRPDQLSNFKAGYLYKLTLTPEDKPAT